MKKIVLLLFACTIIYFHNEEDKFIIPNDAIRFRIIANSNNIEDQTLKAKLKKELSIKLIDIRKYKREYEMMNFKLPSNEEIQNYIGSIKKELKILELML